MRLITTLLLEPYSESCLPEMVKLGRTPQHQKLIESNPEFLKLPENWEFDDRLLAFLAPHFKEDIENYLLGYGEGMVSMFTALQLKSLDRELSNILKEYLNAAGANC